MLVWAQLIGCKVPDKTAVVSLGIQDQTGSVQFEEFGTDRKIAEIRGSV